MPITTAQLAERLKQARLQAGLTQEQAAEAIGVPRTALVQMEAGNRAVSSLELAKLARLYGRNVAEFLAEEELEEDPVVALFRVTPALAEEAELNRELHRCARLARQASHLEHLLGRSAPRTLPVAFELEPLTDRWTAIVQGRYLAEQERNRLDLGSSPIWEIAEIIRSQGVRVTELDMPDEISGLFFHGREVGQVIVINQRHSRARRLFSYAHEYCHLLVDRDRTGKISRHENRQELIEVRANAFAAHFLMPEAGIHSFLASLGKHLPGRRMQTVPTSLDDEGVQVYERKAAEQKEIHAHDVVALAHHFGVSYEAALFHLLNLKYVSQDRFEMLRSERAAAGGIEKALRISKWDENAHRSFTGQLLRLGFEAYFAGEISRNKLLELAEESGADVEDVVAVLADTDAEDAVDAVLPAE